MATKTGAAVLPRELRLSCRHLASRFLGHAAKLGGEGFVGRRGDRGRAGVMRGVWRDR